MSPFPIYPGNNAVHGAVVPIATYLSPGPLFYPNFVNIPQTYQDLRVVIYARTANALTTDALGLNFNSDYGTNYSETYLQGNGSSLTSARDTSSTRFYSINIPGAIAPSGVFGSITIDILNYANTSTYKTIIAKWANDQNGSGTTGLMTGLWRSTAAINEIDNNIVNSNGQWVAGSRISLYGVRSVGQ